MYAITGASGGLGAGIVRNLRQVHQVPDDELVALARAPKPVAKQLGIEARSFDYDEAKKMPKALKGIHTLMLVSTWDFDRRKKQHADIIEAAKEAGVERIVYASAVSPGEDDHLTGAHPATERMLKESGLQWNALRATLYMSLFEGDIRMAGQRGVHVTSLGKAKAALVDRADLARADAAALADDAMPSGKVFTITGPTAVTAQDFADVAAGIAGRKVRLQNGTRGDTADALRATGMAERDIGITLNLEDEMRGGLIAKVSPDLKRLVGDAGTSFSQAMARALQ